jgi:DNA-binding transcriptional ArsR family regulator
MIIKERLQYHRNMPARTQTRRPAHMYDTDIALAAALIADQTRAAILQALLPGRPLAAGELARLAGVSAGTASFHLAKLLDGGMVAVTRQGRHRYYQLSGHEVAAALEAIGLISPVIPARSLRQSREAEALAEARTCYDHLAGRAGVELLDAMRRAGALTLAATSPARYEVSGAGREILLSFGIDIDEVQRMRRHFAGECLDWTQRRGHLNGALAAAITARLFALGWIERGRRRRSVIVTAAGADGLAATFGWAASAAPPNPPVAALAAAH